MTRALHATVDINNDTLRTYIKKYSAWLDSVEPNQKHLLILSERTVNDSVIRYGISREYDTYFLQSDPIQLANVDGIDVLYHRKINVNPCCDISTNKELHVSIAHKYFPEEYKLLKAGKNLGVVYSNDFPWLELYWRINGCPWQASRRYDTHETRRTYSRIPHAVAL